MTSAKTKHDMRRIVLSVKITSGSSSSSDSSSMLKVPNMEESTEHTGRVDLTIDEEEEKDISDFVEEIIKECEQNQNTTEILRVAQNRILTGRPLDITDASREITGETNYILVDRNNILETGISEISTITNFRLPIEVNFIGEAARDYGGPRREFFRLVLIHIKETLFDGGLQCTSRFSRTIYASWHNNGVERAAKW